MAHSSFVRPFSTSGNDKSNLAAVSKDNSENMSAPSLGLLDSLTLVTMNVAGCAPSAKAPNGWSRQDTMSSLRKELLFLQDGTKNSNMNHHRRPDVLAIQEWPMLEETSSFLEGYTLHGMTPSHAHHVTLWIRNDLPSTIYRIKRVSLSRKLPCVMVEIQELDPGASVQRRLRVASCHLEPFREGSFLRQAQLQQLKDDNPSIPLIVAGDTNMRQAEDDRAEEMYTDVWKGAGSPKSMKFTWDTNDHRPQGYYFNQYYGDNTRKYNARYDRVYVYEAPLATKSITTTTTTNAQSAASTTLDFDCANDDDPRGDGGPNTIKTTEPRRKISSVQVPMFQLIANRPIGSSQTHFLSDHFGIATTINLKWT